jgi:2-keto-4-pentenoate hydratase/2-oxohepta-3-ene-1,7-dioic acid hydratase in catechol pathway
LKLVRFALNGIESYGVQTDGDRILDLSALSRALDHTLPSSLDNLINLGMKGQRRVKELLQDASERDKAKTAVPLDKAKLQAPLSNPPKIVCLGLNYRDHIAEQNAAMPDDTIIFMKPRTAIIGPEDIIVKPPFVGELDYEAELAVIIGKEGKNISLKEAKEHIFGYTCFNDVSARDIQFKDKQWTRGKSFDTFAPIGPCITTVDQAGDPSSLWIRTRVNGTIRQDSSTRNMVFNVYEVVQRLSHVFTLEPCDVIATGTPAGVGFAMKPNPSFLASGDVVEIEIENIGLLRNKVKAAK